ncbi:MAG: DUF6799 domain-containing protein [Bacteroidota bacterium]
MFLVAAMLLTNGTYAQGNSQKNKVAYKKNAQKMKGAHPDGVMMKNGKMMLTMNGKTTLMVNEVTLSNGTRVMANGHCMMRDGSTLMLKNGDHMNMDGNLVPMKMKSVKMAKIHPNGVSMQNGRMMMTIKGNTTLMENEVTMGNGTRVFTNGRYILKDGSILILKEGEQMNLGGNIMPVKKHKMKS